MRRWAVMPPGVNFSQRPNLGNALRQTLKQNREPAIPLVPIVTRRNSVKFELKMSLREQSGKFAISRQKPFSFAASQEEKRCFVRIRGSSENKRVVFLPRVATCGSENRFVVPRLTQPFNGECSTRNVDGRAESSRKRKQFRMPKSNLDRPEAAHRNTN